MGSQYTSIPQTLSWPASASNPTRSHSMTPSYKSEHSLHTVRGSSGPTSDDDDSEDDDSSTSTPTQSLPLLSPTKAGTVEPVLSSTTLLRPGQGRRRSASVASTASSIQLQLGSGLGWFDRFLSERPILASSIRALALFSFALLTLYTLLHYLLPSVEPEDWEKIKIPKSFDQLKELNAILQVYKEKHYWRVMGCFITVYLFLQAFSIPGSMYLSILGGAMYGVLVAMPLACFCVATGALLAYFLSSFLGPAIVLNSETWQRRLAAWSERIQAHRKDLISYLIVLRIAPLPPHWFINVVAPHLGISIWHFWISTFLGISGVTYIHTTIGTTLDQMTSSDDFHLISWKNGLGLGGIIVAVLIPVLLRRAWKKDLSDAAIDDTLPSSSSTPAVPSIAISIPSPSQQLRNEYADANDDANIVGHASVYDLGSDEDEEDKATEGSKGKGVAKVQTGDWDKARKVLGEEVGGDEAGWGNRSL